MHSSTPRMGWLTAGLAPLPLLAAPALASLESELVFHRGVLAYDEGQLDEARRQSEIVLGEDAEDTVALHYLGLIAQKQGDAGRAGELDPSIRTQSRYHTGLSEVFLGNLANADAAFGEVEQQSPLSPLGQSAQNLRAQVAPAPLERRWQVELLGGMEFDSNPTVTGDIVSPDSDWRGVIRPRGSYRLVQAENAALTAGYDGYLSFHIDQTEVNLQTHSAWLSGGYNVGSVRLGLRYDYAFTFIDTTDPFRHLHRLTPSLSFREGDWGVTHVSYRFHYQDYLNELTAEKEPIFDRDGDRHMAGASQFFFLPEPFTYVHLGALGDFTRTEGTEWSYDGFETSFGAGYDFPYEVSFSWLYRFLYRDYDNPSAFPPEEQRKDRRHVFTVELAKALTEHWVVSAGGAFTWSNSNIPIYDYDRQVGGAYVTYRF